MSTKSWAAFGKWAFASLAAVLFFSGLACLLGRVEGIEGIRRLEGVVLVLLGGDLFF